MARRTTYKIVHPEKLEKKFPEPFKSLNAVHKFLTENKDLIKKENTIKGEKGKILWDGDVSIATAWYEEDTSRPKNTFNPGMLGYRSFTLEKDGSMSYSKFPMHEY